MPPVGLAILSSVDLKQSLFPLAEVASPERASRAREDGRLATKPLASYVGPARQEYYRKYDDQDNVNTQELMCLQRCNKTDN